MPESLAPLRGSLVAAALSGAWRYDPLPPEISATELDEIAPLLYGSGAAALGWWRVRNSDLRASSTAIELQQAYRIFTLQDALHQSKIQTVFRLLRAAGIEPLLIKGWSVARLYPEAALRPYGDIDICVRPEQYATAESVLQSTEAKGCWTDLHKGLSELRDRSLGDVYARSQLVKIDDVYVRVLCAEDHFGLLCIHFLRHGAWRPLWLCDIGVMLETLPSDFNWNLCLGTSKRHANWITCTIELAHQLLDARIADLPQELRIKRLPRWLAPHVLKQWETPYAINQAPMKHSAPMASYLYHPAGLLKDVRNRWPDPLLATISLNGSLNNLPRFPFQLGNCLARTVQFLARLSASPRTPQQ